MFNDFECTNSTVRSAADYTDFTKSLMKMYGDAIHHDLVEMHDLVDEDHEGLFELYENKILATVAAMEFSYEALWYDAVDQRQKLYMEEASAEALSQRTMED
jgi:hypothetical protein